MQADEKAHFHEIRCKGFSDENDFSKQKSMVLDQNTL